MKLTNFIKRTPICLYLVLVAVLFSSCTDNADTKKAVLYNGEYYSLEYETESEYIFEKIKTECIVVPKNGN